MKIQILILMLFIPYISFADDYTGGAEAWRNYDNKNELMQLQDYYSKSRSLALDLQNQVQSLTDENQRLKDKLRTLETLNNQSHLTKKQSRSTINNYKGE